VDIVREFKARVKDPKFKRTREMKYFKLEKNYWIVKEMVPQAVEKFKIDNNNTIKAIKLLEGNFNLFCRS
jgi:hypothetical protein